MEQPTSASSGVIVSRGTCSQLSRLYSGWSLNASPSKPVACCPGNGTEYRGVSAGTYDRDVSVLGTSSGAAAYGCRGAADDDDVVSSEAGVLFRFVDCTFVRGAI
jgi:hypothetical protein